MLRTIAKQRRTLATGIIATLAASSFAYWLEARSIEQTQAEATEAQIERVRERLVSVQMEVDAAIAMLSQPGVSLSGFDKFVSSLTYSSDPQIRWVVGGVIAQVDSANFELPIGGLLGRPDYKFAPDADKSRYYMPVLNSRGKWAASIAGTDLSGVQELYKDVKARVSGSAPAGSRFDLLSMTAEPFVHDAIWYVGTVPQGLRFEGLPAAPLYVMRGVSLDKLTLVAAPSAGQQLRITIDGPGEKPVQKAVIPVASEPLVGTNRRIEIDSNVLNISMTVPTAARLPRSWILVMLLGLATTAFATAMRAGLFAVASARSLSHDLEVTQSQLDASSFRENTFFEESSTASAEVDAGTGRLLRVNDAFGALFGYSKQELIGKTAAGLAHPEYLETNKQRLDPAEAVPGTAVQFETRYLRKDGTSIWGLLRGRLYQDATGQSSRYLITILDISDRKNDELTRNNLVRELAHRVRNTVQITSSLARQTARTVRSVSEYDQKFRARLAALSAAQDALFESEWRGADIRTLAERTLAPFFGPHPDFDVVRLRIPAQHAQTLAIALHELASNALRKASNSNLFGEISFSAQLEQDPEDGIEKLHLVWREPAGRQTRKKSGIEGFGHMMLYDGLPVQFGGRASSQNKDGAFVYEAWLVVPKEEA